MFKKLLAVGALTTGVLLSSNAMALSKCESAERPVHISGNLYQMYVVNPTSSFANYFEKYGIKWYFKGKVGQTGKCEYNGKTAYQAYYQGRK